MYVCMNLCMYLCIMYVCIHVCMYVHIYACMYECMYVCMYGCMHVCMCVCVCVSARALVHDGQSKNEVTLHNPWFLHHNSSKSSQTDITALLPHYITTQYLPKSRHLTYRGTDFFITCWQQSASCVTKHRVTTVSTWRSLNLWPPDFDLLLEPR